MCTPDLLDQRLAIAEGRCQSYCQLPDPNGFPKVSKNQECRYRRLDRSIQLYSFLHLPICAFEMVFTQRCRSETPLDHRAFAFPDVIVMCFASPFSWEIRIGMRRRTYRVIQFSRHMTLSSKGCHSGHVAHGHIKMIMEGFPYLSLQ